MKKPQKIINEEDAQIIEEMKQDKEKMLESKSKDSMVPDFIAKKLNLDIVQTKKAVADDEDDEDWGDFPSIRKPSNSESPSNPAEELREKLQAKPIEHHEEKEEDHQEKRE